MTAPVTLDTATVVVGTGYAVGRARAAVRVLDAAVCAAQSYDPEPGDEPLSLAYLAHLLADLRDLRQDVHRLEASVEARVARTMPDDRAEFDDLLVERKGGATRRSWDHDLLTSRVAARLVEHVTPAPEADPVTGEVVDDPEPVVPPDLVDRLVRLALATRTRGPWSTSGLRALGVRFDDACDTDRSRRTVHVARGGVSEMSETSSPPPTLTAVPDPPEDPE